MARRVALFAVLVLLVAALTSAQVVARQGEPTEQNFESPMVLEVPVGLHRHELWNGQTPFSTKESLAKYVCENVSFVSLVLQPGKPKRGKLPVTLQFTLKNKPGHDKLVALRFSVLRDGKSAGEAVRVERIDVEEGRIATRHAKLMLSEDLLRAEGDIPILKIELTAQDH
ncbi:MAG: hypothetical protein ACSLFQ_10060 [Thermoanaerobaculia bacterium]